MEDQFAITNTEVYATITFFPHELPVIVNIPLWIDTPSPKEGIELPFATNWNRINATNLLFHAITTLSMNNQLENDVEHHNLLNRTSLNTLVVTLVITNLQI